MWHLLGFGDSSNYTKAMKKADVVEHLEMSRHVGLLFNEPPGGAGVSFI
jgi:hypothetical protein